MKNKVFIISSYTISLVNFRIELIKELQRQNFEVIALGPENDKETIKKLSNEGVRFIRYNLHRNGLNPISDIFSILMLRKILKKYKPNYIIPYTIKPVLYSNIAKKGLNIKSLSLITGLGYYGNTPTNIKEKITTRILTQLYKFALNSKDVLAFQNTDDIDFFKDRKIINFKSNYCLTPGSGVDLQKFNYLPVNSKNVNFLFIGRLIKSKGIELFIEAAKAIKKSNISCTFTVIGMFDTNSPDAISLELINDYETKGIINFIGEVKNVLPFINNCSVFVLPSYYREGVPRTLLEALSVGRPIITTNNVGCRETVHVGENGLLIPIKDLNALINSMMFFITNKDKIAKFGLASRSLAENKFDVKLVNQIILDNLIKE